MANVGKPLTPNSEEISENEPVEVEVLEEATATEDNEGGVVIDFSGVNADAVGQEIGHYDNLAEHMDDGDLMKIGADLIRDYDEDVMSRGDWEKSYRDGLDLLGMKTEDRKKPWDGASGVFHPMLAEAVIRFQSEGISELFPPSGPVLTKIVGKSDLDKVKQGRRVQEEMNYLVTEEMMEYRDETESMLFRLPLGGSAFKKIYYDPSLKRPVSMFVGIEDFVVSYGASDLSVCPRYTHVMRTEQNDLKKMQKSGFYRSVEVPAPAPDYSQVKEKHDEISGNRPSVTDDERHMLLEMHVDIDLPEPFSDPDGIGRPHVVTIEKSSSIVLSIRRNWKEDDDAMEKRSHFVHYKYLPGLGFYGMGLIHLIGGLTKSATSILRQLIDSGTLSNLPGGLKARGLRIEGDNSPISPGEFRDVDVPSGSIRDAVMTLPYKEPSGTLYSLLKTVIEEGRRIGSIADLDISNSNANAPVGTTLALMERSMKVMSAVQARLHASMKKELKLIAEIVHDNMDDKYLYDVGGDFSRTEDFDGRVDIIPVSDPNAATMAQRVMQYQAAIQLSATAPQAYDVGLLHRGMLETLNIKNAEDIVKLPDEISPMDPVSENMAILKQEAIKAFQYQDHEAHISVHMAAMQDPKLKQIVGQSPFASAIMSSMSSHITEHVAMQYRVEIEKSLGVPLPKEGENLPEDVEVQLSRMTANAASKVLGKNKSEAAAAEAKRQQADPLTQIQQRELALKEKKANHDIKMSEREYERKVLDDKAGLEIEKDRIESEEKKASGRLAGLLATEINKGEQSGKSAAANIAMEIIRQLGNQQSMSRPEGEMESKPKENSEERSEPASEEKNESTAKEKSEETGEGGSGVNVDG